MRLIRLLGLLMALGIGGTAQAVVFTVDQSYAFDLGNGAKGSIDPADLVFGPGDVQMADGTVDVSTQDIFLATISLDLDSDVVDQIGITVFSDNPFDDPHAAAWLDPSSGFTTPTTVDANTATLSGLFTFGTSPATALQAGETTVRLLVAYEPLGEVSSGQMARFMISSGVADQDVDTMIVPEPTTALLMALGLVGLGRMRRPRARD